MDGVGRRGWGESDVLGGLGGVPIPIKGSNTPLFQARQLNLGQ